MDAFFTLTQTATASQDEISVPADFEEGGTGLTYCVIA